MGLYNLKIKAGDDNGDPVLAASFSATCDEDAFRHSSEILGINIDDGGRPDPEEFAKAGGVSISRGLRQIFPPLREFSNRRVIVAPFDIGTYKAYIDNLSSCSATGKSASEAVGNLVTQYGDELRIVVIEN